MRAAMEPISELIGESSEIVSLRELVRRLLAGAHDSSRLPALLINGETGTGKGLLARSIHRASPRATRPFVDVNCAAIPEGLIEAEMFGFERGAFTDARQPKPGLFEAAHSGVLFLDEIGLISTALQAKLLKVIEDRVVRRLGATRTTNVDVWIITATSEDLGEAVKARRFRSDLYHRLSVVVLTLPPLRKRGPDIVRLAERFLARACADYRTPAKSLDPTAVAALCAHPWSGNVRELHNVMERVALLVDATVVTAPMLALPDSRADATTSMGSGTPEQRLRDVLARTGGNVTRTANELGITRNTVRARIAKYRLEPGKMPGPTHAAPGVREPTDDAIRWEPARVAFLRVRLAGPAHDSAMRRLLEAMRAKIVTFGGRIEAPSPSGILAVFGLTGGEEPAVHAAHSAIVLERSARQSTPDVGAAAISIGLHCLEMAVGHCGGGAVVLDPDASREAWNDIEALLREAGPGAVAATGDVVPFLRRRFTLEPLPSGLGYRVDCGAWRLDTADPGPHARFVGRVEELALLESRLKQAASGRGQVVAISGDAGIGKSRLLTEFVRREPVHAVARFEGRCLSVTMTTPFFPMVAIIRGLCGIGELDPPAVVETKLRDALEAIGADARDFEPDLRRWLDSTADVGSLMPPEMMKRRLLASVRALLDGRARTAVTFVIVEDLHWIDATSEACLDAIIEMVNRARLLLVVTYRTGYRPAWLGRSYITELTLAPLLPEDGLALVQRLIGSLTLARRILARGEGNPLFLEELSRGAMEGSGALPERVPATIEEAIAARLVRLAPRTRQILNVAAVVGREVPLRVLRYTAETADTALDEALEQLRRTEFVHDSREGGTEPGLVFNHALVHEVAYERVPAEERRAIHRRVLTAFETLYPDRLNERIESLAHHALHADESERAVRYLFRAGRKAVARSALMEGVRHFRSGLELLATQPESPERDRQELEFHVWLGISEASRRGFAAPEVGRIHRNARELCRRVEAGPLLLGALGGLWQFYYFGGDFRTAFDLAEQHRAAVLATGAMNRLCASYDALGYTAFHLGELAIARDHLRNAIALYDTYPRPEGTSLTPLNLGVAAAGGLAMVLCVLGHGDEALVHVADAIARGDRLAIGSEALSLAYAHTCTSRAYLLRREHPKAVEHALTAIEIGEKHGYVTPAIGGRLDLGLARIALGELDEGIKLVTSGLAHWRAAGFELDRSYWLTGLADGHRQRGDLGAATAVVDEALAHLGRCGERVWEPELYSLRARIEVSGETASFPARAHERAAADFERAIDFARAQGAGLFEMRATLGLHHLQRTGHSRAALQRLVDVFGAVGAADLEDARRLLDTREDMR